MIKEINLKYCESNQKYDLVIDGRYLGKHYNIEEAMRSISREHDGSNRKP